MPAAFAWPNGKRFALSLTFDDARPTQPDAGFGILDGFGARATFYVTFDPLEKRLEAWKAALARGHEIGNHTVSHPCTGNFPWSRRKALEDYTLERMAGELDGANARIRELLGVTPRTFAYPCGQTFVGRGEQLQSYVPLVARRFLAGRVFRSDHLNDPSYCDLAQLGAVEFDRANYVDLEAHLEHAARTGAWLVFAGHEVAHEGRQAVKLATLEALCRYACDSKNGVWLATVEAIAAYVIKERPASVKRALEGAT